MLMLLVTGCAATVDRMTVNRVVDRGMAVPDLGNVCALGESLRHMLDAMGTKERPPHKALVIAETTAATCAERRAWELTLQARTAQANLGELGAGRTAEIRDARIRSDRARREAARRFYRAFSHLEAAYGDLGEECPRIKRDDEVVFLVGLVAGELALLHDKISGSDLGVPLDTPLRISRAATCLADDRWWHVPMALEAAGWAIIPGSEPEGVDPWVQLDKAAEQGATSGVRVAQALAVLLAANADDSERVTRGIKSHAKSLDTVTQNGEWALLDEYARLVTLHESDLVWAAEAGHVTPELGQFPDDTDESEEVVPDLFGEFDPFGSEPDADESTEGEE